MRHTAALSNQLPITAYITVLILYNPPATANIKEM